jgi:PRTRC genetic system ThiF family protein
VDTRAARRSIDEVLSGLGTIYWLDLGNNSASGQYVLGQPLNRANRRKAERLRTVSELYPEIVDAATGKDDLPSCSAREALERQEPFINQTLAASALAMLSRLSRYGKLGHHGGFFIAQTGHMSALPIDPGTWAKARRRNRHVFSRGVHRSKGVNFTHESHLTGIRAETGARGPSESCSGSPAA